MPSMIWSFILRHAPCCTDAAHGGAMVVIWQPPVRAGHRPVPAAYHPRPPPPYPPPPYPPRPYPPRPSWYPPP
ncbi:hypothetical protein FYB92_03335 [Novacetimonas sp. GS1]